MSDERKVCRWAVFRDEDNVLHVLPVDGNNENLPAAGHALGCCCKCNPRFGEKGILIHESFAAR